MVLLHDANGEPGQVHLAGAKLTGVFGQLTAQDGAPGLPAALGNTAHNLGHGVGVEVPPQLVVQEKEGLCALAHQVIHAHGNEVDADRAQPPRIDGNGQLRTYSISGRHQQRSPEPGRHLEQAAETAQTANHSRPGRAGH